MELSGERFFTVNDQCELRCVRLDNEPHIWHLQLKGQQFYLYLRHPIGCLERLRYFHLSSSDYWLKMDSSTESFFCSHFLIIQLQSLQLKNG